MCLNLNLGVIDQEVEIVTVKNHIENDEDDQHQHLRIMVIDVVQVENVHIVLKKMYHYLTMSIKGCHR